MNPTSVREHWSFSSLNQLLNICSLQWAFQRLYRLTPEFKPVSLSFGSAFHRTLEWIAHSRKEGITPKAHDASALFDDLWRRQLVEDGEVRFDDEEDIETLSTQGRNMTACFVAHADPEERMLEVNRSFCVPLVDAAGEALEKPLVGEMDCLVEKQGEKIIVDWKSSGRRWPADKALKDLQPTTYLYTAGLLMPEQHIRSFRFDVVNKTKTPAFEQHTTTRTPEQFQRLVALAKVAEHLIQGELFYPAEQSFYCGGCGFQSACKAWQRSQSRTVSLAA
ncbi:MAG: PD-(D/E)XK nuclease family protein [Kiritimatiellaeota bacterium]|nr:PD-(D/E)XK nuclease family protein [Kiritimatiellota bacterium]